MPSRSDVPAEVRNTRQKQAIRNAFREADRPLSPDEALRSAQQEVPRVSLATVYRNITSLVDDGFLTRVEMPGQPPRYEVAGKKHHHHFHCNDCGKVYELDECAGLPAAKLPKGFRATGHEIFLYGSCADCAR